MPPEHTQETRFWGVESRNCRHPSRPQSSGRPCVSMKSLTPMPPLAASIERVLPQVERFISNRLGGRLRNCFESSDVAQEVAVAALRAVDKLQFECDRATLAWLRLAARRAIVDLARTSNRWATHETGALHPELEQVGMDPFEAVLAADQHCNVNASLKELSLTDRSLLADRFLHEMSYTQLASRNACSCAAIRVRVHRALGRLRSLVQPSS